MKTTAIFYHAGCPVCIEAESSLTQYLDQGKVELEIIHLGETPARIVDAENAGVKSVPALVLNGTPLHINFGANISDLK
ncbi:MAG: thioredoxin family protein [Verrucomicrobiales bacterium]|nr:thioredoxin family protein [Verrucomicrobiales bacterium]